MSACVGIFRRDDRPVDERGLRVMTNELTNRGPDGAGIWCRGAVGLGHAMLCTTPESRTERQPVARHNGRLAITADARIDNRDELIGGLGLRAADPAALGDSTLILAAYEKWGHDCVTRLLGDFAFAVWDARNETLFCARDPMGVKPFYYHAGPRLFAFASEIKALFTLPDVPREADESQIARYAERGDDRESTFFRGILRLPAAHTLVVGRASCRLARYWSIDAVDEIRLAKESDHVEAFREIFTDAVRCRMRSAYPIGCTLSGGLDSSSIACTARTNSDNPASNAIHTFSAIFPSLPAAERAQIDERGYVQAVVAAPGFVHHEIRADELSPLHDLAQMLERYDEPPVGYNMYIHRAIYDTARAHGVRVVLDGTDGDTAVNHGWVRLLDLARSGDWATFSSQVSEATKLLRVDSGPLLAQYADPVLIWLACQGKWRSWLRGANALARDFGTSRLSLLLAAVKPRVPHLVYSVKDRVRRTDSPPSPWRIAEQPRIASRRQSRRAIAALRLPSGRDHHVAGIASPLFQRVLELTDIDAAAARVEARYPFFDRRVLEFCVSLPMASKLDNGWSRLVLRQAMNGVLPHEVQWRTGKSDLSPNFNRQLRVRDRRAVAAIVEDDTSPLWAYMHKDRVRAMYERFMGDAAGSATTPLTLYDSAVLGHWLRALPARLENDTTPYRAVS